MVCMGGSMSTVHRLITAMMSVMLCVCTSTDALGQNECEWPTSNCNEPWTGINSDIWVTISTNPACSVKVRVHWLMRCGQYEVQDISYGILITSPSGCATPDDVAAAWADGRMAAGIRMEMANLAMLTFIANGNTIPPCSQSARSIIMGKLITCNTPYLHYSTPSGEMSLVYDLNLPWSYYQQFIDANGGTLPVVRMHPCAEVCCYLERRLCMDGTVLVHTDMPAYVSDDCPDQEGQPCRIRLCE